MLVFKVYYGIHVVISGGAFSLGAFYESLSTWGYTRYMGVYLRTLMKNPKPVGLRCSTIQRNSIN